MLLKLHRKITLLSIKGLIMCVGILIYSSSIASTEVCEKIVFVIQHNEPFSMRWEDFEKEKNMKFILLTTSNMSHISAAGTVFSRVYKISDLNVANIKEICEKEAILAKVSLKDCYFTTQDEYALEVCAELRKEYGSYGDFPDAILPYRDKMDAKKKLKGSDVPLPKHMKMDFIAYKRDPNAYIRLVESVIGYPAFIKPTNEARCKNVYSVKSRPELENVLSHLEEGDYEIDEFIEGDLYTAVFFIKDSQINFIGAHRFLYPCFEFMNSKKTLGGYTLPEEDPDSQELNKLTFSLLKIFPLSDGVGHIEFMKSKKDNRFLFIECAARQPGGYISALFEKRFGYNLGNLHYSLQSQLPFKTDFLPRYFAAWYWPNKPVGVIKSVNEPFVASQYEISWRVHEQENVKGSQFLGDSTYRLLLWNKEIDSLKNDLKRLEENDTTYQLIGAK